MKWGRYQAKHNREQSQVYLRKPKHISIFVALGQLATEYYLALKMALSCHSQQPLVGGRVILFRFCPAVVSPTKVEELLIAEGAHKAV